jgi:GH35 family endo-1,4-beta-xylanase
MATETTAPTRTTTPTETTTATTTSRPSDTPTPELTTTPRPPTLRTLADARGVQIGDLIDQYEDTRPLTANEFNLGVATFSWRDHVLQPGQFNFRWTDFVTLFALENDMQVRFHALVFPQSVPDCSPFA